ncbi:MAG: NAD-dependent epimerase/dehydratase family protein, partial [Gaiellaceae bacterium]
VKPAGKRPPRRALVTGAGGFVGANLVRRLLADGLRVVGLVRPGSDPWRLAGLDVELVEADVREAVPGGFDLVFHLAAHGAYSWQEDDRAILETNLIGTVNALGAGRRVVVAGSSSEYGRKPHPPAEDEPLEPNSAYAVGKAASTLFALHHGAVVLRLYSAYGPWEEPNRLVPTLLVRGLQGELPPLVSPAVARDFVHVDDVCEALVLASRAEPGRVFNVGSGRQTTVAEVVDAARRLLGVEAEPVWGSMPDRAWDTETWIANPERIRRELGWEARIRLEEGLARTLEWLRRDAPRERYGVPG